MYFGNQGRFALVTCPQDLQNWRHTMLVFLLLFWVAKLGRQRFTHNLPPFPSIRLACTHRTCMMQVASLQDDEQLVSMYM